MLNFDKFLSRMTPEEKERLARRKAEQAAIDARTIQIRAIRTNAHSGQVRIVMVGVYPVNGYLRMVGGPTGWESMPLEKLDEITATGKWCACFGTEDRWDKLEVPGTELERVRKHLK